MKFGYRDRIVLLIACVIIIFGIGIFVFIKPKYEDLKKDKKSRDTELAGWRAELTKFEGIPDRQQKLEDDFKTATEAAGKFTDAMDAIGLDKFLRENFVNTEDNINDATELEGGLSVSDQSTASLSYYYYSPSVLTYPLYELADMDGSLAAAAKEKRKESDILSTRSPQTVGAGTSSFTLKMNRSNALALIDGIHDYAVKHNDAMIIHSVGFSDYKFLGGLELDEDGNPKKAETTETTTPGETEEEDKGGTSSVTISYSVYYMQKPTKPDVGAAYDPSVWDTDAWKTFSQAEPTAE